MNFLDMRTILFNLAITNLICAMVMSALWIQNRKHTPAMGFWFADYVLQVLSIPLIFLRGVLPFFISAVVGNFLVMTGTLLLYIGLERFVGRPSRQTHNYILLGLFALTHTWFTLVQPDMQARNINFSIILLLFSAQIAWLMLRRVAPEWRPATRPIGWLYLIYGLVSLSRVFVDLTYPPSNDLFKSGTYDTLVILIYQMLFIGLTFSLTLMSNRRLVMDLEIDDLERNHAERLLKQSQEKFALAFQNSPDTLIITRLVDGKIIEVNQGFHDMSGYTAAEIAGKTTFDLQLWDSIADRTRVVDLLKSDGKVVNFETRFRRKSGAVFTGLVSAEIVQLPEGLCSLTVIHDISSRKQAEDALRETRDYLENLIGYANAPIITWDPDYVITRFNRAFERMTGYTAAEIVGQRLEFLFPAQDREASLEKIARATGGEFLESVEIPIQRKDGVVRIALWNSANIYAADGVTLTATIAQGQDITERKQQEEDIRASQMEMRRLLDLADQSRLALLSMVEDQKAAQEQIQTLNAGLEQRVVERTSQLQVANKELEAFAYSVSHDLRAPLRGIDGWSLALLEDYSSKLDDSGKEYLHRVRSETQRMGQLIDDLLRLSRVSRVEMVRSEVNLSDLVESITKRIQKEQPDRAFDFVIQPGLKSQGDFHLLEIALSNLLENAAKFTGPQQHPRIEFGKMAANGKNPYFIRDNGVGFDMAYRDKLFGAFQRLHRYAEFPGTGIGLATVARVILRHGGSIWAEAQVNQGAVFYFTLGEDKPS